MDMNHGVSKEVLIEHAQKALCNAYAPYSGFKVGAAIMTVDGKIYTGCNVENASYGVSNCAERTALFKAVSQGERDFVAIAIVSSSEDYTYPCGVCRQALVEFSPGMKVFVEQKGIIEQVVLEELLPRYFSGLDIK